MHKVKKETVTK